MSEHFGAVEADFQAHYGLDLRAVLWGTRPVGVRRLLALVDGLPTTGAMFRQVAFGGQAWSMTDELLAALVELTDFGNRLTFQVNAKKGSRAWKPVTIHRPRRVDAPAATERAAPTNGERRKPSTKDEVKDFFGKRVRYTPKDEAVTDG